MKPITKVGLVFLLIGCVFLTALVIEYPKPSEAPLGDSITVFVALLLGIFMFVMPDDKK